MCRLMLRSAWDSGQSLNRLWFRMRNSLNSRTITLTKMMWHKKIRCAYKKLSMHRRINSIWRGKTRTSYKLPLWVRKKKGISCKKNWSSSKSKLGSMIKSLKTHRLFTAKCTRKGIRFQFWTRDWLILNKKSPNLIESIRLIEILLPKIVLSNLVLKTKKNKCKIFKTKLESLKMLQGNLRTTARVLHLQMQTPSWKTHHNLSNRDQRSLVEYLLAASQARLLQSTVRGNHSHKQ